MLEDATADELDFDGRVLKKCNRDIGAVRDNGRMKLHGKGAGHRSGAGPAIQEYNLAVPDHRRRRLCDCRLVLHGNVPSAW